MSYCSICGIRYQNNDLSCAQCGNELAEGPGGPNIAEPDAGEAAGPNKAFEGTRPERDADCQLGKGLIKPHSVELDIDGFHFKYDKPPRNFVKNEIFKDKVIEFRLACPEPETVTSPEETFREEASPDINPEIQNNRPAEISPAAGAVERVFLEEPAPNEGPVSMEVGENAIENDEKPLENEMWVAGDILTDEALDSQVETESTGFPEQGPEPPRNIELLWEDSQRWLGIPTANQYRISNRSLQIINRLARKFSEIDLALISDVKLKRSWFDKLAGTGDLLIGVKHLPGSGLALTGIRNPEKVLRLLEELLKSAS